MLSSWFSSQRRPSQQLSFSSPSDHLPPGEGERDPSGSSSRPSLFRRSKSKEDQTQQQPYKHTFQRTQSENAAQIRHLQELGILTSSSSTPQRKKDKEREREKESRAQSKQKKISQYRDEHINQSKSGSTVSFVAKGPSASSSTSKSANLLGRSNSRLSIRSNRLVDNSILAPILRRTSHRGSEASISTTASRHQQQEYVANQDVVQEQEEEQYHRQQQKQHQQQKYRRERDDPAHSNPANTHRSQASKDAARRSRVYQRQVESEDPNAPLHVRVGRAVAGMLDSERSRARRERTFVGNECAVCEEPLEHTLRGERVLQFSCGDVAHEACFYEYIKEIDSQTCPKCDAPLALDSTRGGNVLDLEKLSSIVRSVAHSNDQAQREMQGSRQGSSTPLAHPQHWEGSGNTSQQTVRQEERPESENRFRDRESSHRSENGYPNARSSREHNRNTNGYAPSTSQTHARNESIATNAYTSSDYADSNARRHDYDVQAMESDVSRQDKPVRKPIPPPTVMIRSEYPTLTRSKVPQTLTCLVTIEVPQSTWLQRPPEPVLPEPQSEKEVVPSRISGSSQQHQSPKPALADWMVETPAELEEVADDLRQRCESWHGLEFPRFGPLSRHGVLRVSRDQRSWQELECFLFQEMLICVKAKRGAAPMPSTTNPNRRLIKCTLRGSIQIKKHLRNVESSSKEPILTLSLAVEELPRFHLQLQSFTQLAQWKASFSELIWPTFAPPPPPAAEEADEDEYGARNSRRKSSMNSSSWGPAHSVTTAPTEYTGAHASLRSPINLNTNNMANPPPGPSLHIPVDIVVVIPVSSSMAGLKISLLRDSLRFLVSNLGDRDRMGLVTFGSGGGGVPLVGMTSIAWAGWAKILGSIKPAGQKSLRADVVDGANVAMDLLMQRKSANPISAILLISDSSTSDPESVDFVVSRAEAAKIAIHSFGLGTTHKPDTMIDLSARTKASYTYVRDWMMLRECLAGSLGSLQSTSHQNVKLKLRLPEGSPAKFGKIQGALNVVKRTGGGGREAEAMMGDLRFGDKRDVLVQFVISPESSAEEMLPQDHWESIVSGLEALGGVPDTESSRSNSIEEIPLVQADLTWDDSIGDAAPTQLPRPTLLAITMLPMPVSSRKTLTRPATPPIPPLPAIVQRRMEILTSDMLTRALYLVSRGQHDRAQTLLIETRSILKGLAKGGLPPTPSPALTAQPSFTNSNGPVTPKLKHSTSNLSIPQVNVSTSSSPNGLAISTHSQNTPPQPPRSPDPSHDQQHTNTSTKRSPPRSPAPTSALPALPTHLKTQSPPPFDSTLLNALDAELESSLEWIAHPAVFGRDARKAVLQAIGVIASQRGYTFRSEIERLYAIRIGGIKERWERAREWRGEGDASGVVEEV